MLKGDQMKKKIFLVGICILWGFLSLTGCGSSVSDTTPAAATYQNSNLLVSAAQLAADINNTNQVIIDIRSAALYAQGHVPGAINLTVAAGGQFEKGGAGIDKTDLKTPAEIAAILSAAGVANTAKILVYGSDVDASAGRMFWMLEYLGASDVHVLDGGYAKWLSDRRPTSTTATTLAAATFTPAVVASRLATKADVLAHYADTTNYAIVDSRNAADTPGASLITPSTGASLPYNTQHIPNAINILTGDYLNADKTVKSYSALKAFLDGKGITAGKTVIPHCYVGYRSAQEYFIFRLMGYNVSNYDGSWTEWYDDAATPKATSLLVSDAWLAANIANANQVIIDVRSSGDYNAGHITGAISLPVTVGGGLFDIGAGGDGITNTDLKPAADIAVILGNAGVADTNTIIVYGKNIDMLPGRMFWMLEYLGAGDVRVLDGGYDKWVSDGRATTTTAKTLTAATFVPAVTSVRLATKTPVLANYANTATYAIVDSREAVDFNTKHIPNAINILTTDLLNADGTVKSFGDLKTLLDGQGLPTVPAPPTKKVITNCYVGYRSAQEYLIFRVMGFNVSNYDGSWAEWSADPTPLPTAP